MKILCTAQMGINTVMGQTMRVAAIARELQRRGHKIQYIAAGRMVDVIRHLGLEVLEVADMPLIETYSRDMMKADVSKEDFVGKLQQAMEGIAQLEARVMEKSCPDLVISGTLSGASVARQFHIPALMVFLQPHGQKTFNMAANRLQDNSGQQEAIKSRIGSMLAAADRIILEGMPEISGGVSFENIGAGFADIKDKLYFTGPLLIEQPDSLPSKQQLKHRHIGDDRQMAYVTIGGGSPLIGEQFLSVVLEAFVLLPEVAGVIATGVAISPEEIERYQPPANVSIRGFVPGTELIKASDVTVFHGGSSTLMTCIACGTPAVVVPSMGEQEDNGAVLSQHGAGIVLDKKTLTPAILADAIRRIIADSSYQTNAGRIKALGEKYGGAGAAADLAEQLLEVRI